MKILSKMHLRRQLFKYNEGSSLMPNVNEDTPKISLSKLGIRQRFLLYHYHLTLFGKHYDK